jgi:glycosyltransferase involved in cell wall biosynthesis
MNGAAQLKILMVSPQFRPIVGGYERAAERLSRELVSQGTAVTVITERRYREWPRRETIDGFGVMRFPSIYRPRLHMLTSLLSFAVWLLCTGRRHDVFHVHQYGYHLAVALVCGRLLGRPVVLKLTSTGSMGIVKALAAPGMKGGRLLLALHRRVDGCLVTSQAAQEEAFALGIPPDRVHLIPNGIDLGHFRPAADNEKQALRRTLGLGVAPVVLYVGRLSQEKNPAGLLAAWELVRREFPDAQLVIVGAGPLEGLLRSSVADGTAAGSVRIVGASDDVLSWYRASDLFVLPSLIEGLSNSLIEAMACGLPVVSTRVSGSEDVFAAGNIGELVATGETEALADGIGRLLADPDSRRRCGAIAREVAEAHFSLTAVTRRVTRVYAEILGEDG